MGTRKSRDLFDVENAGEFAFTMSVFGVLYIIVAVVAAFFTLYWAGWAAPWYWMPLAALIWMLLNVATLRSLKRRAARWGGERRASHQIVYVELCSLGLLAVLSLLSEGTLGSPELMRALKYIFCVWILALLLYQVVVHLALSYRIRPRDAIRWCCIGALALCDLWLVKR